MEHGRPTTLRQPESLYAISGRKVAVSNPRPIRVKYLPPSMVDSAIDRYMYLISRIQDVDQNTIFGMQYARTTLEIIADVAVMVYALNLPTKIPPHTVTSADLVDVHLEVARESNLVPEAETMEDRMFVYFWQYASTVSNENVNGAINFKVLRSIYSMLYGIQLRDTFDIHLELNGYGDGDIMRRVGDVYTNGMIYSQGYNLDFTHGIAQLFILVSAFLGMIDQPDRHVFSTMCGCISCRLNPAYVTLLSSTYMIQYPIENNNKQDLFVFLNIPQRLDPADVNTLMVCDRMPNEDGRIVMIYHMGGVVFTTDQFYLDGIISHINDTYNMQASGILFNVILLNHNVVVDLFTNINAWKPYGLFNESITFDGLVGRNKLMMVDFTD